MTDTMPRTRTTKSATAPVQPAPPRPARRAAAPRRGRSTAGSAASRAPRTPFVLLVVGLLGGAMVSLLLLNTVLAEDAFRLHDLQRQNTYLQQREQALKQQVKEAEAPEEIARRARRLGGRPGPQTPAFVSAGGAKTLGDARSTPADGGDGGGSAHRNGR